MPATALCHCTVARLLAALLLLALAGCAGVAPQWPTLPWQAAPAAAPPAAAASAATPQAAAPPRAPMRRDAPDATPRVSELRSGPPNQDYEIRGEPYSPHSTDVPLREVGVASWYGRPFHGRRTATGERYDMNAMTAAHKTMPLPSYARVRNLANGREVIVRVNDRGPFHDGRVIDLSRAAARKLRISGVARVEVQRLTNEEIRSGAWRRPPDTSLASW